MKKRLYRDGEKVRVVKDLSRRHPELIGQVFTVVGYRKGTPHPYRLSGGWDAHVSELRRYKPAQKGVVGHVYGVRISSERIIIGKMPQKGEEDMGTIREKIRELARSKDEKNAIKTGFLSDQGNLTDVGRRTLLDYIWETNDELRAQVFADINKVVDEECSKKKS